MFTTIYFYNSACSPRSRKCIPLYIAVVKIRNLNDKLKKIMAIINRLNSRSSRPEVFRKKGNLKHFTKLTEKRQCRSILLIKIEVLGTSFFL